MEYTFNLRNIRHQLKLGKTLWKHQRTYHFWQDIIKKYEAGMIKKWNFSGRELGHDKIIWQYWGQGIDDWQALPPTVQLCFDSVDRFKGDYTVIRLSDDNIQDYIALQPFVYDKLRNNKHFTRTFLSDLLRVSLLTTYGGVWLDATILLTGELPQEYANMEYFMFQRSDDEKHQKFWEKTFIYYFCWHPRFRVKLLNSIIFAKQGNLMMRSIMDLLLYFWQHEEKVSEYFFFQILYQALIDGPLSAQRCAVVNDCYPHIIQGHVYNQNPPYTIEEALQLTPMHKLSYFDSQQIERLHQLLDKK